MALVYPGTWGATAGLRSGCGNYASLPRPVEMLERSNHSTATFEEIQPAVRTAPGDDEAQGKDRKCSADQTIGHCYLPLMYPLWTGRGELTG